MRRTWLAGFLLIALVACSPRQLLLRQLATELAAQDAQAETDLLLARDASAFYLKLSESVLQQTPDHLGLAQAVAGGFTQYAYAFVAWDAERIEGVDARAAQLLRERAAALYARGQGHALAALERRQPGFRAALASPQAAHWPRLAPDEVGLAYWAAASWGGLISLSKDSPHVVADLPLVLRLAALAYAQQPSYGEGALASLMGTLEAGRPGGSATAAASYFETAIQAGNAAAWMARAEALALPAQDRAGFERGLREALARAKPDLAGSLTRQRARWLLDHIDDYF